MTQTAAVHASGLVKTFGDLRAVDGIDLEVSQGEGPRRSRAERRRQDRDLQRMLATSPISGHTRARCASRRRSSWRRPRCGARS